MDGTNCKVQALMETDNHQHEQLVSARRLKAPGRQLWSGSGYRPGLLGGIEDILVRCRSQFDDRQLRLVQQPQAQGPWICGQSAWRRNGQLAVGNDNAVIHRTAL